MKCQRDLFKKKRKIKTMNDKWQKYISIKIESKKLSRQEEQKQNRRCGDHLEGYHLGGGRGRMGIKVQGLRSTNW